MAKLIRQFVTLIAVWGRKNVWLGFKICYFFPPCITNSRKSLNRRRTQSPWRAGGEAICSAPSALTASTHNAPINTSCLGSVGTGTSGMFCFVSFATAVFHPQDFTPSQFFSQSRLQNFQSSSCVEPHRNICKAHSHHSQMFFLLRHVTVVSVVKWRCEVCLRLLSDGFTVLLWF